MDAGDSTTLSIAPETLRLKALLWDMATTQPVELSVWFAVLSLLRARDERLATRYKRVSSAMSSWRWVILERNSRTYGERRVGIGRVNARTGGPITIRAAFARLAWIEGLDWIAKQPLHRANEQMSERMRQLEPEIMRLKELHAGDRAARDAAVINLYKSRKINPFVPIAYLVMRVAVVIAPGFLTAHHQAQLARLVGTVVVVDD
jgi:hypothetical protein